MVFDVIIILYTDSNHIVEIIAILIVLGDMSNKNGSGYFRLTHSRHESHSSPPYRKHSRKRAAAKPESGGTQRRY